MWGKDVNRREVSRKKAVQWVYRKTPSLAHYFSAFIASVANRDHHLVVVFQATCSRGSLRQNNLVLETQKKKKKSFFSMNISSLFSPTSYIWKISIWQLMVEAAKASLDTVWLFSPLSSPPQLFLFQHLWIPPVSFSTSPFNGFTSLHVFFVLLTFLLKFFLDDFVGKGVISFWFSPTIIFFKCPFLF